MESYSLRNIYLSNFVVQTVYIYVAMMLGWSSFMIPYLETFLKISTSDKVAILGSLPLGMMIGPVIGSLLVPRFGYRSMFLQFGCLSLTSVVLLTFRHVLLSCVARFAGGVAISTVLCYAQSYIHDISDQHVGVVLNHLSLGFLSLGLNLVYGISQTLIYFEMLLVLLIVPVLILASLTWLPESPYVLVSRGSLEKAKKSVDFLHRGISTRGLNQLMDRIQQDVAKRESEIFTIPFSQNPKAAKTYLAFFILLPLTGFPVVLMLMQPMLSEAVLQRPVWGALSAVGFICPILLTALQPYTSPRIMMAASAGVMSISMVTFGIFFYNLENGQEVSGLFWVPVMCMLFYTTAFLIGFAKKPQYIANRPQDCGRVLTMTAGFFSLFLVVVMFLPIKYAFGTTPILWSFSIFSIVLTVFVSIFSPDATIF